jgi:hypothetical protein
VPAREDLAVHIAEQFTLLPGVVAVVLGGSTVSGSADAVSDIDCYVYAAGPPELDLRRQIAAQMGTSSHPEIGNEFWEPGDEWRDLSSGISIDIIYRRPSWLEDQLQRVLIRHEASVGYSTCIWHNVRFSSSIVDRDGWYERMKAWSNQPYPEPLRRAIITKNQPILRRTQSSYCHQLALAIHRHDLVSVQHRITALLASYFDILFALNRLTHPGEKRLIATAQQSCSRMPKQMDHDLERLLEAAVPEHWPSLLQSIDTVLDRLDALLQEEEDVQTP